METSITYKCPNCGAGLKYDAAQHLFACEFCLSKFTENEIEAANPKETEKINNAINEEYNENMNEYECPSCGAHIVADQNTVADFCYYCHNPVTLVGKMTGQMKPQRIIPFAYDKKQAEDKFLAFAKKKWFVPNNFFAPSQAEKISGIYYPFWITDADTSSNMNATAHKVRSWISGSYRYTETKVFNIYRSGDIHFEDITTSAFTQEDKHMVEGILPFPSEALKEFSATYLSGFLGKKRDIESEDLAGEVRNRMSNYSTQILQSTIVGYSSVHVTGLNLSINNSSWEYALLPIWVLTYQSNNPKKPTYTYAMNGHTGKIYGELPISKGKIAALFAAIAIPLTAILTLIGGLLF